MRHSFNWYSAQVHANAGGGDPAARRRDPAFREKVLLAYEYRCCVCGQDLRLKQRVNALEAVRVERSEGPGLRAT